MWCLVVCRRLLSIQLLKIYNSFYNCFIKKGLWNSLASIRNKYRIGIKNTVKSKLLIWIAQRLGNNFLLELHKFFNRALRKPPIMDPRRPWNFFELSKYVLFLVHTGQILKNRQNFWRTSLHGASKRFPSDV